MKGDEPEPCLTCPPLDLKRVVGFNGHVKDGLHIVEGEKCPSMLFPLGSSCIIEKMDKSDNRQVSSVANADS